MGIGRKTIEVTGEEKGRKEGTGKGQTEIRKGKERGSEGKGRAKGMG